MDSNHCQPDKSNGYEAHAQAFIRARNIEIGGNVIREWAQSLPTGAAVLDVGCGHGIPISQVLIESGFTLYAVDASATLIAEYRRNFPQAHAQHCAVEDSGFFQRTFDGIVAWGLMFLLSPETQAAIIAKIGSALKPGGRFLFTAPEQPSTWQDILTGRSSVSLGAHKYRQLLLDNGLVVIGQHSDEGDNHYFSALKSL